MPKLNKRSLLKKFILFPKGSDKSLFSREMKMLNSLLQRYSEEFLLALELPKKYDSLAIFLCSSFKKELDLKFKNFNYKIDYSKYEAFDLNDKKFGQDISKQSKPKTIRGFLND